MSALSRFREALAITALRLRPDETASRWSAGQLGDLRVTLARATTDYVRTSYPGDFAAALVPGSAQQVYRDDLPIAAGEHRGAGVAPFVVDQYAVRGALDVVELTALERPEERPQAAKAHEQRNRQKDRDPGHFAARTRRSEFAMTTSELVDIATAASSGVR